MSRKIHYNVSKSLSHLSYATVDNLFRLMLAELHSIYPLSRALRRALIRETILVEFKKGDIIHESGKVNKKCYFAFQGLVKAYYVDDKGKQHISWVMKERNVIICVRSFLAQLPSHETLEALEDTICICLSYEALQEIYLKYLEFNFIGRVLTERYYIEMDGRAFSLRMEKVPQRYHRMAEESPDLLQRVSQIDIASYLGTSAETVSRIRSNRY